MADKTTKRVDLDTRVTFGNRHFGPGKNIEVPADFPEDEDVEQQPLPERIHQKPASTPPNTGGVNTGVDLQSSAENVALTISGKTAEELKSFGKARLVNLAEGLNLRVDRMDADGNVEEGEPLVGDYVRALSAPVM